MNMWPVIIILTFFIGCAAPPKSVTLSELVTTPELYLDSTVSFSGLVKESNYKRGHYYTGTKNRLELAITDGTQEIYGYMEGYRKGHILTALMLAERAEEEGEEVTVTGKVISLDPKTELKLSRIHYKGDGIVISESYIHSHPGDPHYGHRWHYNYDLLVRQRYNRNRN